MPPGQASELDAGSCTETHQELGRGERGGQYRQQAVVPLWKMTLPPKYQKLDFYQITLITQVLYEFLQKGSKSHNRPSGMKAPGALLWEIQQGGNYAGLHSCSTGLLPASRCQADCRHPPCRPASVKAGFESSSPGCLTAGCHGGRPALAAPEESGSGALSP